MKYWQHIWRIKARNKEREKLFEESKRLLNEQRIKLRKKEEQKGDNVFEEWRNERKKRLREKDLFVRNKT